MICQILPGLYSKKATDGVKSLSLTKSDKKRFWRLKSQEQTTLRRAFIVWINRVLLPVRLPGLTLPQVDYLLEVKSMLAERVKEWIALFCPFIVPLHLTRSL